jgi:hypothetical protein
MAFLCWLCLISIYLSIYRSIYLYIYISIYLSIYLHTSHLHASSRDNTMKNQPVLGMLITANDTGRGRIDTWSWWGVKMHHRELRQHRNVYFVEIIMEYSKRLVFRLCLISSLVCISWQLHLCWGNIQKDWILYLYNQNKWAVLYRTITFWHKLPVLVPRKYITQQVCIDYRKLNLVSEMDQLVISKLVQSLQTVWAFQNALLANRKGLWWLE